jgi:hypothetical protein
MSLWRNKNQLPKEVVRLGVKAKLVGHVAYDPLKMIAMFVVDRALKDRAGHVTGIGRNEKTKRLQIIKEAREWFSSDEGLLWLSVAGKEYLYEERSYDA